MLAMFVHGQCVAGWTDCITEGAGKLGASQVFGLEVVPHVRGLPVREVAAGHQTTPFPARPPLHVVRENRIQL